MSKAQRQQYKGEWPYRLLLPAIYFLFYLLFTPKIKNRNYIPKRGRAVIAANHKHALDPIILMTSTFRPIHFMAKKEHFESLFGWLFEMMSCIYVDRDAHDGYAMKEAISFLENEKIVGIFPEGTRNRTHDLILQDFKFGAVAMARRTGSVIVPAAITGDYRLFSRNLLICYGEPFAVPEDMPLEEANGLLRNRIEELWHSNLEETGRTETAELNSRKTSKKGDKQ